MTNSPRRSTMGLNTSGDTRQSLSIAACRCAHAGVIFSPPHLGLSIGHTGWKRLIQQEVTGCNEGQKMRDSKSIFWPFKVEDHAGDLAFPSARGMPLSRDGVDYLLKQAVRRALPTCPSLASKPISPHVIRHTTAMHLLQAGVESAR